MTCNSMLVPVRQHSSVHFSPSVMSDSLRPHGQKPARPSCPSSTPGVYSNSCSLSWWCHPTISVSVVPFSSSLQSFPASGSFLMRQFFESDDQSSEASMSAAILPMNTYWFPLGLTGLISLQSKRFQRSSPKPKCEITKSLMFILLFGPILTSIHDSWENHSFD